MNRFSTLRSAKYLVVATAAFTAGYLSSGTAYPEPRRLLTTDKARTADVPDLKVSWQMPVFSPQGALPEPVVQVGLPGPEPLKVLPGFICLYDRRNRIPRWTLELLIGEQLRGDRSKVVDRYFVSKHSTNKWRM